MTAKYDMIGIDYTNLRKPDPRIAAIIEDALGSAQTVLNVGAGAGSYEPAGKRVTAVEPSMEMIRQRASSQSAVVQASAERLPFEDNSFDAAMAVLTIHHWKDQARGLAEMRRVTRGKIVLLTFDPTFRDFWLTDYFPELIVLDEQQMPAMEQYPIWLGQVDIAPVPIPHNCCDGFLAAYWRRPAAYLDHQVRKAMSSFWAIEGVQERVAALAEDMKSGVWDRRYGHLLDLEELDCGYRLVVASS